MSALKVRIVDAADRARWEAFLELPHRRTLFHHWAWGEVVERVYGWKAIRFIAERDGHVVGVLPLTDFRSPIFGKALISTGFSVGGGVLAVDDEARLALERAALDAFERQGGKYLELRGGAAPEGPRWSAKTGTHVGFEKALPAKVDEILSSLAASRRGEIRRTLKWEAEGKLSFSPDSDARAFHALYARLVHTLGTPTPPAAFFVRMKEAFGDKATIALATSDGEAVAAAFCFWCDNTVAPYYIGTTEKARALKAYDYLYYSIMCSAVERGVGNFDFGRSRVDSPHARTKEFWGFVGKPQVYHVATRDGAAAPNVNPSNPKYALLSRRWTQVPAPLAHLAGPHLARHLP
jgi:FemAB-related protein (PEP-CTERM system-associated)